MPELSLFQLERTIVCRPLDELGGLGSYRYRASAQRVRVVGDRVPTQLGSSLNMHALVFARAQEDEKCIGDAGKQVKPDLYCIPSCCTK